MELSKQKSYQQAFDLACASLREKDLRERAEKAGVDYENGEEGEKIHILFFSESYTIRFPEIEFSSPGKKTISLVVRALLLHYLLRADGSPFTGEWAAYKDLAGGLLYASVFARRVTEPLIKRFGRSAKLLQQVGDRLGGRSARIGDASFHLLAFPRIPLQYVLWEGDEEFPPSAQLLFDSSVDHYLPLEDIVVLGQITTGRLISLSNR
jgi:Domain of unknown function (DUF3786)